MPETGVSGRIVVIAGATSTAGYAAARTLSARGARVVAVGRDAVKLEQLAAYLSGVQDTPMGDIPTPRVSDTHRVETAVCDLTDEASVSELADRVHTELGAVDGVLHLVGGWRGGGGLAGQSDDDFRFLEQSLTALRHVSRAFDGDLRASAAARLAIVSSTAVARPLAGGANYAAVKAASEAWTRAVAQGFAKGARDAGEPLHAASVVFRVASLAGLEQSLADAYAGLWDSPAETLNDQVITLAGP